jgi:hypothetical protein
MIVYFKEFIFDFINQKNLSKDEKVALYFDLFIHLTAIYMLFLDYMALHGSSPYDFFSFNNPFLDFLKTVVGFIVLLMWNYFYFYVFLIKSNRKNSER